jgi:hypothetical protein
VSTYAAVFQPGGDATAAVASLAQLGAGWRVLRVLASHPVPVLILAHRGGGGPPPRALLLPVPAVPACFFISPAR